ncbi:MAG: glycosyltransferase family 9 protein [Chitinivibrionales bacterium]|nr:glycosyltransferase family 9 protein [Chitinivibrionales bacterium]
MERIVVTPLDGMGDTLMTTPALQVLKENRADVHITYFVYSRSNLELLKHNPNIDRLWSYPLKSAFVFSGLSHILRRITFRFDTCINFYPSNRRAYNLFSLFTGARKRVGHTYSHMNFSQMNWLKNRLIAENTHLHCVEENILLLKFFGISIDHTAIPALKLYLTTQELDAGTKERSRIGAKKVIGVHAGTNAFKNHAKRRWSPHHFAECINELSDYHFILFGAGKESEINQSIQESVVDKKQVTIVADRPLREVAALIGSLDAFISNDSGMMHVAAAMNVPTVALLGPTNPQFIHPWKVRHEIVRLGLPCSPCFYYSPRPLRCRLHNSFKCMKDMPASMVVEAVRRLLG